MDPIRFGRGIRALRQRRGWRQEDLAREARLSRGAVARIEQGRGDRVPYRVLATVAATLGARVFVRLEWQGELLDRLIDARHAMLVELVVRELSLHGWLVRTEATFNVYGERGSVDVIGLHSATGVCLVVEVKSALPELGAMLATLDRKVRLAKRIAEDAGWKPRSIARLLVVLDDRSTRRRLRAHAAILDAAFPIRGWDVRRWLRHPSAEPRWSGLWVPAGDPQTVGVAKARVMRRAPQREPASQLPALDRREVG